MDATYSSSVLHARDKCLSSPTHLSDSELLLTLFSEAISSQAVTTLLKHFGNVRQLAHAGLADYLHIPGTNSMQYAQLQAALELSRRSDFISLQRNNQLKSAHEAVTYLKRQLRDKRHETVSALFLDSQHHVIAYEMLFTGSIHTAAIHPRPIVERALCHNAAAIMLGHNHPSGHAEPSKQDHRATKRLNQALSLFDMTLLDHIIIGDNTVYSLMREMKWVCY